MKKAFFGASAVLLSWLFALSAFAAARTVEDFDHYADNAAFQKNVTIWESGGNYNIKLSTKAEKGKSLQIIPTGERNGAAYGVVIVQLAEKAQNWEGAEGVRFWAKATGGTAATPEYIGLGFMFDDGSFPDKPERWAGKDQMPYKLIPKNGKPETMSFMGGGLAVLPDGFEGYVEIPFSSMEALGWSVVDDELQLTNITSLYWGIDAKYYRNKEVFIDSIQIYGAGIRDDSSGGKPAASSSSKPAPRSDAASSAVGTTSGAADPSSSVAPSSGTVSDEASEPSSEVSEEESESSLVPASSEESGKETVADPEEKRGPMPFLIAGAIVLLAAAGAVTYFVVLKQKQQ